MIVYSCHNFVRLRRARNKKFIVIAVVSSVLLVLGFFLFY